MRKPWAWAIFLIALLLVTACRPAAGDLESGGSEVLGACKPEEDCDDESTAEMVDPTAAPAVESEPQEAESAPVEEPPALGDDPLAVTDADWVEGPDDAFITLIEYGDFQ